MRISDRTRDRTVPEADGSSQVGAVLLAAGESTRFGDENKLLARIDGSPIVRHAAEIVCDGTDSGVTVIIGHDAGAVRDCLADLPVSFRTNPKHDAGQSTSVREGIFEAEEQNWKATVFALGDMPFVSPENINSLIESYKYSTRSIVAAAYNGIRGNPVLFDQRHYPALKKTTGDFGGRFLVENHPDSVLVETTNPGVIQDIDHKDDLPTSQD